MILFLISWFLTGFVTMLWCWSLDMRGMPLDEDYFVKNNYEYLFSSLLVFMIGFIGFITVIICLIYEWYKNRERKKRPKKRRITKFIHKMMNVGVKNESAK